MESEAAASVAVGPDRPAALLFPAPVEAVEKRCEWALEPGYGPLRQGLFDLLEQCRPRVGLAERMRQGARCRADRRSESQDLGHDCRSPTSLRLSQNVSGRGIDQGLGPVELDHSLGEGGDGDLVCVRVLLYSVDQREQQRGLYVVVRADPSSRESSFSPSASESVATVAPVVSPSGNHVANATARVWHVAVSPRDDVDVHVVNRLAGRAPVVYADVVAVNARLRGDVAAD